MPTVPPPGGPPPCYGPGYDNEIPNESLNVAVGFIYTATAIFSLVMVISCAILVYCYYKRFSMVSSILPPPEGRPDPFGQVAKPEMPRLKGPRNAALVKDELVKALTKAEELKAELDALMNAQSDETGPSLAIAIR